jgi:hypothetical protein
MTAMRGKTKRESGAKVRVKKEELRSAWEMRKSPGKIDMLLFAVAERGTKDVGITDRLRKSAVIFWKYEAFGTSQNVGTDAAVGLSIGAGGHGIRGRPDEANHFEC